MSFYYNPKTISNATVAIPNTTKQIIVDITSKSLSAFSGIEQSTVDATELFYIQVGSEGNIKLTYDGTDPSTSDSIMIPADTTVFPIEGNENIKNIQLVYETVNVTCVVWFERMV